jgi:hypothetical protein
VDVESNEDVLSQVHVVDYKVLKEKDQLEQEQE